MNIIFIVFSVIVFIKTISYGIFEIKTNNNTFGGIVIFLIALFALICPNIIILTNGLY